MSYKESGLGWYWPVLGVLDQAGDHSSPWIDFGCETLGPGGLDAIQLVTILHQVGQKLGVAGLPLSTRMQGK